MKFLTEIHSALSSYKLFAVLFPTTIIVTTGMFFVAVTYKVVPDNFKVLIVLAFFLLSLYSIIRLIKTIKSRH